MFRHNISLAESWADPSQAEAEALKLQVRLEDLDFVWDGEGQGDPEGLQDLHLLDGLLARGRQDAQCAPGERQ
jgi:hypothetical protein